MKAAGTGDKPKPPKETKPPVTIIEKKEKPATLEDADKAIKIALYDNSIDASAVKTKKLDDGTTPIATYVIEINKNARKDVLASMRGLFEDIGFKTTGEGDFSASNEACGIIVIFTEPKTDPTTEKPSEKPTEKPVVEKPIVLPANAPKLAIVIDDCGYSLPLAKRLAAIKYPVTFAIIPHTEFDSETAEIARAAKKTVFLHFPMEPLSYPEFDPGQGTVLTNMPPAIIEAQANNNVKQIGKIDGFNNHTGSAYTENKVKMQQLLGYMKKHTDTFLDSWTSSKSVAYQTCLELGMKCAVNRKFLDNENDEEYIRKKIAEGIEQAKKTGSTIMIGHLRENTVRVLEKYASDIEKAGVRIVPVTELTHKKK
jgi:polysaccharide deacetylase 2 family uncharacterized protein YibQ